MSSKIEKFLTVLLIVVMFVLFYVFGFTTGSNKQTRAAKPCDEYDAMKRMAQAINGPQCDDSLWAHIYHSPRLVVQQACTSVTGTWQDASHGRTADGCRHEKDGDGHCWLKLDVGQDSQQPKNGDTGPRYVNLEDKQTVIGPYLNPKNMTEQDGNLVVEPICVYRTTQQDAKQACHNWHQQVALPKIGAHVRVTGAWVLDTQHGHMEIHPVSKIEIIQ